MPASLDEPSVEVGVSVELLSIAVVLSAEVLVSIVVLLSAAVDVALELMVVWMGGVVVGTSVGGNAVRGGAVSVAVYKLVLYSVVAEYGVYEGVSEVKL